MKKYFALVFLAFSMFKAHAQSSINGDLLICPNMTQPYTVAGSVAGCGSKTYTVIGGVFPNFSNQTSVTTSSNAIDVKWSGTSGSLSVQGNDPAPSLCSGYAASRSFSAPSVPEIYTVFSVTIPCGSTSNFFVSVLVDLPPAGTNISTAPNGPQSFSLPSGFQIVNVSPDGTHTEFGQTSAKYKVQIQPTDPSSSGNATVRNYFNCGSGGEIYSTAKSFSISRTAPAIPLITTSSPLVLCNSGAVSISSNTVPGANEYQWEANGGVTITSGNGSNNIMISANSTGNVRVKSKSTGCGTESGWSNWFKIQFGPPQINYPVQTLFDASSNMWQLSWDSFNYPSVTSAYSVSSGSASLTQNVNDVYASSMSGATIQLIATNTCGSSSPHYYVIEPAGSMLLAYPNPATDYITLDFKNTESKNLLPQSVSLYSEAKYEIVKYIDVQEIYERGDFVNHKVNIDVKYLARGIYYIHVNREKGLTQKSERIRIKLE